MTKSTSILVVGALAALCGRAAAQSDEWLAQDKKDREATNYKIALQELDEAVKQVPAPGPGLEKAPVRAPAWCASKPGKYADKTMALDATRRQLDGLDRYWRDALLGGAEGLCDADAREPTVQRAAAFILQHYMNRTGLSADAAAESIKQRMNRAAFDEGKTRLCEALQVSEEVQGPVRMHMAARRDLFDCGGNTISGVGSSPMVSLVPWIDASATEPDELVRLAYVAFESRATEEKTLYYYVGDQLDYRSLQPDRVLALLEQAPYAGNPYAQAIAREELASARAKIAQIEAEVKKLGGKDEEWSELLVAAPQRGLAAWNASAQKWKAELFRSNELEEKAYGASRKAMKGCTETLLKDLSAVLGSYAHDTAEELRRDINDKLIGGLLIRRYVVCLAADGQPMVAMGFRRHLRELRVSRGPRAAAYYAALDALNKIREDRAKFPVAPNDLPFDRTDYLDTLAAEIMSQLKFDTIGYTDVQKGVVKAAKKGANGVTISFNPAKRQIYTEACTTTNRILMFANDGRPIYDRICKPTGLKWVDESPDPILVPDSLAAGIAPGKMIVFAVVPYNSGDRHAMPLEVYGDKSGKKLVNFFGIPL